MEKRGVGRILRGAGLQGGRDVRNSSRDFSGTSEKKKRILSALGKKALYPLNLGSWDHNLPIQAWITIDLPPAARMFQPRREFIPGRRGEKDPNPPNPAFPTRTGAARVSAAPGPERGPFPCSCRVPEDPGGIGMIPKPPELGTDTEQSWGVDPADLG